MDFYQFADQAAVERDAQKKLNKVLSDKSYTNPQKISLLLAQFQKRQVRLDAQLSKAIKSQIQSINQSKLSVQQANNWMKQANDKTQNLKQIWNDQYQFHQLMQDVTALSTYENNISKVIQQLTYFIDMESQMTKLQKMAEDQTKYIAVNTKLMNLLALRDALSQDSSWKRQTAIMRKQFVKVDNFQIFFYDKICQKFHDCLKAAKDDAKGLAMAVKVVQAYDKNLKQRGKPQTMRHRAIQMIKQSIDNKFTQKLQGQDQLIGIIQNSKFATTDLVQVSDYVQQCFPKDFKIMQLYQRQYQQNIQKHIIPFFDTIQQQAQYGNLVALLGWIDDYQTLLSRAGLDSTNLVDLKSKVKILMPQFIDHNQHLVYDYIKRCLEQDEKNYTRKYYQQVIRDGSDLVSFFPSDIFRFINQQAELIKDQLKGEIFVQFVRCITQTLSLFQRDLTKKVLDQFDVIKMVDNQQKIVQYQYKCILFINNYNECLKHAGESKQLFSQIVSQDYRQRIQKIFLNEVQKQFNSAIPKFINVIVQLIFMNLLQNNFPILFTSAWAQDNNRTTMNFILKTMSQQLADIQSSNLIVNIIHYRMLAKQALQYLVNAYIQQFILTVRIVYNLHSTQPLKYCSEVFTQKKMGDGKEDIKQSFNNSKNRFIQGIKNDKVAYLRFSDSQSMQQTVSKTFINKQINKFVLLGQLLSKKKSDFENMSVKVAQVFPEQAADLMDVVLVIRDDNETKAALKPKKGIVIPI